MSAMEQQGPPVNLLSGTQLRLVARIRTLRPSAELRWRGDGGGWSLEVVEHVRDGPDRTVLAARLDSDGTIETTRSWL
jgi:hypothetical protein